MPVLLLLLLALWHHKIIEQIITHSQQQLHRFQSAVLAGQVEGRLRPGVHHERVGSLGEQQRHDSSMAVLTRRMKRGFVVFVL